MSEEQAPSITEECSTLSVLREETGNEEQLSSNHPLNVPLSLTHFDTELQGLSTTEEKLSFALHMMRTYLDQSGSPFFKGFWHARTTASTLFKENMESEQRTLLWNSYRELCDEFNKLKTLLDESSLFASEQIEMAISALTEDLNHFEARVQMQKEIELPAVSQVINKDLGFTTICKNNCISLTSMRSVSMILEKS